MIFCTGSIPSFHRCPPQGLHRATLRPHGLRVPLSQVQGAVRLQGKPQRAPQRPLCSGSTGDVSISNECPLPRSPLDMISQAQEAIKRGLDAGHTRQRLQLILPVNEKQYDFLATDAVDYPCSLQREFESCCSLVTAILEGVTGQKEFSSKRLDEGGVEGEPCAVLYTPAKDFAAVVFPTSDKLKDLQSLAKEVDRPLLIVNCQWNDSGQVISDFGIGPWKKAADDFLNTFQNVYALTEQRVGSPGSIDPASGQRFVNGGVLRILLSYPGQYQAHVLATDGTNQYLSSYDNKPSYKDLEDLLQSAREANLEFFNIASRASSVVSPFIADGDMDSKLENLEASDEALKDPSNSEIDAMDVQTLRKYLTSKGLPTSGRVVKLKERLKDAYKPEA